MTKTKTLFYIGILVLTCVTISIIFLSGRHSTFHVESGQLNKTKQKKKFLYITFVDGPNFGTGVVLDAFKASGGKGTFFINCLRICTCETDLKPEYYDKGNCSVNQAVLLRMVQEGHTLGDHSSDHMAHNHVGHGFHYVNAKRDMPYFGDANIVPITTFLRERGIEEELVDRVKTTMTTVKRLPFTDIWSVPGVRTGQTTNGRARSTVEAIKKLGGNVYGWDLHWGLHWSPRERRETREVVGVRAMIAQLRPGRGRQHGKLVLLSHDYVHLRPGRGSPSLRGSMRPGSKDLALFIAGARAKGWSMKTLDTFPTD